MLRVICFIFFAFILAVEANKGDKKFTKGKACRSQLAEQCSEGTRYREFYIPADMDCPTKSPRMMTKEERESYGIVKGMKRGLCSEVCKKNSHDLLNI